MVPPDNGRRPAMQLRAVDLPHPDGPSSATNSPRRIVIVSSLSAANAWPPAPAKRRVTRSRRSSLKSCFIGHARVVILSAARDLLLRLHSNSRFLRQRSDALGMTNVMRLFVIPRRSRGSPLLFCFLRTHLLVPDPERFDLRLRRKRLRMRELREPSVVLRTPEFLDRVLAVLRRHR